MSAVGKRRWNPDSRRPVASLTRYDNSLTTVCFIRVAVMLRRENHYCINSRQLQGRHQVECRHLELMGYTVVEVPHFIWYSMAHATQEDKMQYLKDLIFPAR
ncbi:FAST kinase domain-containing protein 1, mitochondrial [Portunus trituberculatus]|uniref:FAST kinase domain-containing protein 1, mitochondrial n=1 Tax=Portunus trituberculatus TaxID=210409 RepID=A0A5B7DRS0_PORTR|nr:FAST kinase domain-containing protein 1, mitochondrial [Portunus trituberculatus]